MKILLATYWYIPHLGGVWPLMCQIKETLEKLGHEVDIFGNTPDGLAYHIVNKNLVLKKEELVPFIHTQLNPQREPALHSDKRTFNLETDRYYMELAASYFGLSQYDIIHTQDVISTWSFSRVKPAHVPLFASIHGVLARETVQYFKYLNPAATIEEIQKTLYWKHYYTLDQMGTHSADLIHASSKWTHDIFATDYKVPPSRMVKFQYGINIEEFLKKMDMPTEIKKPAGKKVIIYTGRLVDIKGVHFLLPALALLKSRRSDWECWIVGDGIMKDLLIQKSEQLGLTSHVKFLGSRNDVPALLKLADIFVIPSLQDNMPLSLIEAQLAGKAIVTSNAGGLPEMVQHGVTGLVAQAGDKQPLFRHLLTLVENDEMRRRVSTAAKNWALHYWSVDLMVERLLKIYNKLIANK
ncbi:glycosyltransferase family 4 protein [Fictibacillus iocasae]|uniref:Glycosyltransferase family 4 protein n=1 Tax=Fictibacillus iocasae TaxID=2715437 RepID=A0ABW2NPI1_9BACL